MLSRILHIKSAQHYSSLCKRVFRSAYWTYTITQTPRGADMLSRVLRIAILFCCFLTCQPKLFGQSACCENSCAEPECFRWICDPPGKCGRNWVDVDYLLFFSDGYRVPNLVTSSPAGTPRDAAGVLGNPGTSLLSGGQTLGDGNVNGWRISMGRWLDDCGNVAITGDLFGLNQSDSTTFPSDPNTIVARPFFNSDPSVNAQDSELVNFPGVVDGTISITNSTDIFSGGVGIQRRLCCCVDQCNCSAKRVDLLFGYRAFSLEESLVISESLTSSASSGFVSAGTTFDVTDWFETENSFHGVEIGLLHTWQRQRWTWEALTKVALGNVRQRVRIDGETVIGVPGADPFVQPYGLLATPTNIGVYERDKFGVFTQAGLEVGYQVNCRLKLKAGYTLMFLSDVVRPGSAVDLNVNATHIDPLVPVSGPNQPAFNWSSESLILHGLNFGVEFLF